jgi:hypothetical protein
MGNVLSKEKREQVVALGRLGWSLRRIEEATGVRRETASEYLRSAGIPLRSPGGWGHGGPAKPAIEVTTDSDQLSTPKPAIRVTTDSGTPDPKPAIEVTTGFLLEKTRSAQDAEPSLSACEPYRELIELELGRGRNAMGIWQLCRDRHSCQNAEFSTMPSRGHLARAFMPPNAGL